MNFKVGLKETMDALPVVLEAKCLFISSFISSYDACRSGRRDNDRQNSRYSNCNGLVY